MRKDHFVPTSQVFSCIFFIIWKCTNNVGFATGPPNTDWSLGSFQSQSVCLLSLSSGLRAKSCVWRSLEIWINLTSRRDTRKTGWILGMRLLNVDLMDPGKLLPGKQQYYASKVQHFNDASSIHLISYSYSLMITLDLNGDDVGIMSSWSQFHKIDISTQDSYCNITYYIY